MPALLSIIINAVNTTKTNTVLNQAKKIILRISIACKLMK